jgi:hypothetical protein
VGLDRNAALAFKVHGVKDLFPGFPFGDGSGEVQKAIGKGRFAMVDMGDDAEIANALDRVVQKTRSFRQDGSAVPRLFMISILATRIKGPKPEKEVKAIGGIFL